LAIRHSKAWQEADAPRHTLILRLSQTVKQDGARITGADQLAAQRLEQVLVVICQFPATHFARLNRESTAHELAENSE